MGRSRYKKLADLYAAGKEIVFSDDSVMWMQVPNEFERADCRRAAQSERAKLVLALREVDTPEWEQMQGAFYAQTPTLTIDELCNSRAAEWYLKVQDSIENDPSWREKLDVLRRIDETRALPEGDIERQLHDKLNVEYLAELTKRLDDERAYYRRELEKLPEDELLAEYKERWIDRRGAGAAMVEFALWELYLGARCCEAAVPAEGDGFDHSACNHRERAFETPAEVRDLPDDVKRLMREALDDLAMTEREAKNSDRSLSSSTQSQGPSTEADSTVSIPTETELQPLGT